jgi:hypothetical protein
LGLFFYDKYGGTVIGVLLKPEAFKSRDFNEYLSSMAKNNPLTVKYSFFLNQTKETNSYFAMPEMHKRSSYLKI